MIQHLPVVCDSCVPEGHGHEVTSRGFLERQDVNTATGTTIWLFASRSILFLFFLISDTFSRGILEETINQTRLWMSFSSLTKLAIRLSSKLTSESCYDTSKLVP
jgi:hypothetical protein